jgi:hypothetical protein
MHEENRMRMIAVSLLSLLLAGNAFANRAAREQYSVVASAPDRSYLHETELAGSRARRDALSSWSKSMRVPMGRKIFQESQAARTIARYMRAQAIPQQTGIVVVRPEQTGVTWNPQMKALILTSRGLRVGSSAKSGLRPATARDLIKFGIANREQLNAHLARAGRLLATGQIELFPFAHPAR